MRYDIYKIDDAPDDFNPSTYDAYKERVYLHDRIMKLSPEERTAAGYSQKDLADLEKDIDELGSDKIKNEKQSTMDNIYYSTGNNFNNWYDAKTYIDSHTPKYTKNEDTGKAEPEFKYYVPTFDRYNKAPIETERGSATLRQRSDIQDAAENQGTVTKVLNTAFNILNVPFLGSAKSAYEEGLVPGDTERGSTLAKETALDALTWLPYGKGTGKIVKNIPVVPEFLKKYVPPMINGAVGGANIGLTESQSAADEEYQSADPLLNAAEGAVTGLALAKVNHLLSPERITEAAYANGKKDYITEKAKKLVIESPEYKAAAAANLQAKADNEAGKLFASDAGSDAMMSVLYPDKLENYITAKQGLLDKYTKPIPYINLNAIENDIASKYKPTFRDKVFNTGSQLLGDAINVAGDKVYQASPLNKKKVKKFINPWLEVTGEWDVK